MILADSVIWVDHLRQTNAVLADLLQQDRVLCHPMVIGEVAVGHFRERQRTLEALRDLPTPELADHDEVMAMIEEHRLFGSGIGYVDTHLLAAAAMTPECFLWTRDKRLQSAAERMKVYCDPRH